MAEFYVYLGRWTDYSRGSILGDQITMTNDMSAYLIIAFAVLNTFVGAAVWQITSFALHQLSFSGLHRQNGLSHQLRMLLRNSDSANTFLTQAISARWAWRKKDAISFVKFLFLLSLAFVIFVGFIAASFFLSQVQSHGAVLLLANPPGTYTPDEVMANLTPDEYDAYITASDDTFASNLQIALALASSCYGEEGDSSQGTLAANCDYFAQKKLSTNYSFTTECPFSPELCQGQGNNSFVADTGFLDSNTDLGINGPVQSRIQIRSRNTCSPLVTDGFSSGNYTSLDGQEEVMTYSYGGSYRRSFISVDIPLNETTDLSNVTFVLPKAAKDAPQSGYIVAGISEMNTCILAEQIVPCFTMLDSLRRQDGFATFLLLANQNQYAKPTLDPWFEATEAFTMPGHDDLIRFRSTAPAQILGCVTDIEVRNPVSGLSAALDREALIAQFQSPDPAFWATNLPTLALNDIQADILSFVLTSFTGNYADILSSTGPIALQASQSSRKVGGPGLYTSSPLPDNQWQIEIARLQNISLAGLQFSPANRFVGFSNEILSSYVQPAPAGSPDETLAKSFKVHNDAYSSFPVLALGLIFGLDGLLLLTWAVVLYLVPWLQKRRLGAAAQRRRQTWITDSLFNTQAQLYHVLGEGEWEQTDQDVPTTKQQQAFEAPLGWQQVPQSKSTSTLEVNEKHGPTVTLKERSGSQDDSLTGDVDVVSPIERPGHDFKLAAP